MKNIKISGLLIVLIFTVQFAAAQKNNYSDLIAENAAKIEQKVIAWRHDIHQNPELGNRESNSKALPLPLWPF